MFRNCFIFPDNDINPFNDLKNCDIEYDSLGRVKGSQIVDQFDAQPFMMGENGFRRSDIAILASCESEDLRQAVSARISEISSFVPDSSLTEQELADMAIPRYCQSSSSFRDWSASLEKSEFSKAVDDFISKNKPKESDDTIKFNSESDG